MTGTGIQAGDPAVFSIGITFGEDPDQGAAAPAEDALSWGGLQVWVSGRNLCLHQCGDAMAHEARWYMLPVLEWFIQHWDALMHEERLPLPERFPDARTNYLRGIQPNLGLVDEQIDAQNESWYRWWTRHALRSCRGGGLLPDLFIRRWRAGIEFSWGNSPLPGAPDSFYFLVPRGTQRLAVDLVSRVLYDFVGRAIGFLEDRAAASPRIQHLRRTWSSLRGSPEWERSAWRVSLGDSLERGRQLLDVGRDALGKVSAGIAGTIFGSKSNGLAITEDADALLMFGTVAPTIHEVDVARLTLALAGAYHPQGESPEIRNAVRDVPIEDGVPPYTQGYELAMDLIDRTGNPPDRPVDIDRMLHDFGVKTSEIELDDTTIRGVAVAGPNFQPSLLRNRRSPFNANLAGRRFTDAHELCHLLFDRAFGRHLAMASGPWAPRDIEQRANAFAAMLLMPIASINRTIAALGVPLATTEGVRAVAEAHQTSTVSTLDHLFNLQKIDEADRMRLRSDLVLQ